MPNQQASRQAQLIAMLHVHSTTALCHTGYAKQFGIKNFNQVELAALQELRKHLNLLADQVKDEEGIDLLSYCRSACFVLKTKELEAVEKKISSLGFVQQLIDRAIKEAGIFYKCGIRIFEIENVGAPYFIGNEIPIEELFILHIVAKKIRHSFPDVQLGIQVLSCGELEALPIALSCGAFFIRSEASLFKALRPEGETNNRGNLAKFYYLRNFLKQRASFHTNEEKIAPQLWCDFQKKHSLFEGELNQLKTWSATLLFQKIEGVILTGSETGSAVHEDDLKSMRKELDALAAKLKAIFDGNAPIQIPLITGSGSEIEMYAKYADYMIIGTAFKKNQYWENEVDEGAVSSLASRFLKSISTTKTT